ncbi:MAG: 16S rRNA (guanine(966)-N(2))-methyltransferase RsmD, partial [Bacteroidia bacterium]|nr:16S rRNA (guanine(966)-N(2))-methyltransferase RsmD [Bacteroidia bacterium]
YSLIFLDPPYKEGFLDEVLEKIYAAGILTDDAIIICESDAAGVPIPPDEKDCKLYRYGRIHVSIFRF